MAITVVNGTPAQGLEFTICGYVDGSANPPMWSGNLQPYPQDGYQLVMEVSGYETYAVGFYTVGWLPNNEWAIAWSPEVTDETTVSLTIIVE
ncbi:MAG TPA: hypothetical protein VEX60_03655 [Pyrinomonadaceae bacterium]|nr:hypothetical protein [Pyrinomonadaceae bacterium]